MKRHVAILALGGLCGCEAPRELAPIVVDIAANCASADVDLVVADLDDPSWPWAGLFAVSVDAPGLDRMWLLVAADDPNGGLGLALWHLDGDEVDVQVPLTGVDPGSASFELRPGAVPGQAYLLARESGFFRIWHVDANRGPAALVAVSPDLGGFPNADLCDPDIEGNFGPCVTTDWHRDIGFVEGRPALFSVPPMSPTGTTFIYVGTLSENLAITLHTQLEFFRECDAGDPVDEFTKCTEDVAQTRYPKLEVLGNQIDPTRTTHRTAILREREVRDFSLGLEVVVLRLQPDESGDIGGILQSKALNDVVVAEGPPTGLAVDDFATYLLHLTDDRGPAITRLGSARGTFDVLDGVLLDEDDTLVQMDSDVALARVEDGQLRVTKLFPDSPERSETTVYGDGEITGFDTAGVGALLLYKEDGGPDLVRLTCSDPTQNEEG